MDLASVSRKRGANNKRKSRSSRVQSNSVSYVTRSSLNGGKFPPGINPPDVTYQPWWPITVIETAKGGSMMTVKSICDRIRTQTDPNKRGFNQNKSDSTSDNAFRMQIKIHSVSAWNLTGRMLALSIEDFTDSNTATGGRDQLCGIVDTGTPQHTPAVGYKLPLSASSHVLRNDDKGGELSILEVQAASTDVLVIYIKTSFRFDGPVRIPTYDSPLQTVSNEIRSDMDADMEELNSSIQQLTVTIDKLIEKQPSTVSKVVEGVTYLATYVLPLGASSKHSPANTIMAALRDAGRSDTSDEALGLGEPFVHVVGAK
jgi:hypothetical protein